MKAIRVVAATALVVVGGSAAWNVAAAQQNPVPAPDARRNPAPAANAQLHLQAPIGHRQPRPDDLPAPVLRDENSVPAGEKAIDKDLRICRDC